MGIHVQDRKIVPSISPFTVCTAPPSAFIIFSERKEEAGDLKRGGWIMFVAAVSMMLLFAAWLFRNYWWRIFMTKRSGTETEACVSRIESRKLGLYSGGIFGRSCTVYDCYASFRDENGRQIEFRLLNPKRQLEPGSLIRIRYFSRTQDYAVVTEVMKKGAPMQ